MIKNFKNVNGEDMDLPVCRHLTLSKFVNMLSYSAIWFPKLNVLQDQFEGMMPEATKNTVTKSHQKWKKMFASKVHHQFKGIRDILYDLSRDKDFH